MSIQMKTTSPSLGIIAPPGGGRSHAQSLRAESDAMTVPTDVFCPCDGQKNEGQAASTDVKHSKNSVVFHLSENQLQTELNRLRAWAIRTGVKVEEPYGFHPENISAKGTVKDYLKEMSLREMDISPGFFSAVGMLPTPLGVSFHALAKPDDLWRRKTAWSPQLAARE